MAKKGKASRTAENRRRPRERAAAALLFLLALGLRVLFWQATPDAGWSYSAWYKGDTPTDEYTDQADGAMPHQQVVAGLCHWVQVDVNINPRWKIS